MTKDKEIVSAIFNYGKVKEDSEIENTTIESINIDQIVKPPESITKAIKLIYLSASMVLKFAGQAAGLVIFLVQFVSLVAVYQLIKDDSSKWTKSLNEDEISGELNSGGNKRIVSTEFNLNAEENPSKNLAAESEIPSMRNEPKL